MRGINIAVIGLLLLAAGWASSVTAGETAPDSLAQQAAFYFDPLPEKALSSDLIENFTEKVTLGQRLFFDPRLSLSQTVSCHSCHNFAMGGPMVVKCLLVMVGKLGCAIVRPSSILRCKLRNFGMAALAIWSNKPLGPW
ncbi:MAG: cytochrome c peroxidase [Desulfuromonas sp.]|nr:cytochrome c peroxidase [Desulfuromonas sp.]